MIADLAQQGKSREEIAERMKEALAQIKHTKSNRPVFTPEFLARLKHIVVFNPLDAGAMAAIGRKAIRELQRSWAEKRCKRLEIPEVLVMHLATQAAALNDKSKGKEGGRIVQKLVAEWIESPLQRAISNEPGQYIASTAVTLRLAIPEEATVAVTPEAVSVHFLAGELTADPAAAVGPSVV
jgi:ATP-dependent Clp protease ATP-binding subunit ClpA